MPFLCPLHSLHSFTIHSFFFEHLIETLQNIWPFALFALPLHTQMKKYILILLVVAGLVACGNRRQQEVEQFRTKVRSEFLKEKLAKAQEELAHTDSLLQARGGEGDSTRGYLDSLEMAAEVQGAQIRYIHKKQKDLQ